MSECGITNQIATHCDEPESDYCPVCESPVTEQHLNRASWLECDNQQCGYVIELGEGNE